VCVRLLGCAAVSRLATCGRGQESEQEAAGPARPPARLAD
jgi:hypothetical protein